MTFQEAGLVLGDERAGAGAKDGNLLLDLLDIVIAGLEIDLFTWSASKSIECKGDNWIVCAHV